MAKLTWQPLLGIEDFKQKMDRLFEEMLELQPRQMRTSRGVYVWQPQADVFETSHTFTVQVELPGVALEDVHLEVREGELWVYGERRQERDAEETVYQMLERVHGPFARKFALPRGVDTDAVHAAFRDGLLTVTIPKQPREAGCRRILISFDS